MKSISFIFIFILFFLNFFGYKYLQFNGVRTIGIACLFFMYYKGHKALGISHFSKPILLILLFILINMITCSYFREQSVYSSFRHTYISYYVFLTYFVLRRYTINIHNCEKAILSLGILFCLCYLWQFFNPYIPLFISEGASEAVATMEEQQRFRFTGQAIASLCLFLSVNKFLVSKNKRYLLIAVPSLVCILLFGFRSLTVALLAALVLLAIKVVGSKAKVAQFMILLSLCICIFYFTPWGEKVYEDMMARQQGQTFDNQDYVRMISLNFHLNNFFKSPLEMFLGAGVPVITDYETSDYGKLISDLQQMGIIYQDWGMLGYSWIIGVVPICGIIYYCMKSFFIKVPAEYTYIGVWCLFLVFSSITTAEIFRPGAFFLQMFSLAMLDQILIINNNMENEKNVSRISPF